MHTRDLVVLSENLYDRYPNTGYKRLRYPKGTKISRAEYMRLLPLNPQVKRPELSEPHQEPEEPGLAGKTRAQLMVMAKTQGIPVDVRMTKAQLLEALGEG